MVATKFAKAPSKPEVNSAFQTNHLSVFQVQHKDEEATYIMSALHKIDWEPPRLGSSNFEKARPEANMATTRAEALKGQQKVQMEEMAMDVDQEETTEELIQKVQSARRNPGKILEAAQVRKDKHSAESLLLAELDKMKIPTNFSHLTAM